MNVDIYTDGSCRPNPGPGGWAAILVAGARHKEISGGQREPTTNNEMEMTAILEGLKALRVTCDVTIHTDSQLVIGWLQDGWKCKSNPNVIRLRNQIQALWKERGHRVRFVKVPAHAGHPENELADALARSAAEEAVAAHRLRPRHLE